MSTLRQFLFLEIKDMFIKYNLIYYRVNLVRLEQAILTGSYKLSFFWVTKELGGYPIKMDRLTFWFESLDDDYWQLYLTLKLEDELILISLANLLNKYVLTKNFFLEQSFAGQTDKLFVAKIRSWSNLRVLFVIDLSIYSKILCRKRLIDKIKPLIEDPFILNLIESFLHSPVLDKAGKNLALKGGIPPVRFIHSIFFNDDMDRKFLSKFPGATFARFSHQLLIPIGTEKSRNNIRVRDLEKAFFLAELDSGIIIKILKPGDGKVVSCNFGNLLLNKY